MNVQPISNALINMDTAQNTQNTENARQASQTSFQLQSSQATLNHTSTAIPSGTEKPQSQSITAKDAAKAVEKMNRSMVGANLKVEFANNAPANEIWINVVDKTSGKVIQQLPPESIRKALAGTSVQGLLIDQKF